MIFYNKSEFIKTIPASGILIGLDIGKKKVGIAITDFEQKFAMPLKIVEFEINEVTKIIIHNKSVGIVIGLPLNMNGETNDQCKFVEEFAKNIYNLVNLPIYLCDERLSTKMANSILQSKNLNRKTRNQVDDMVSACIILENAIKNNLV